MVAGGKFNTASGRGSMIVGGEHNTASGDYSFASGQYASATNAGSFVWNDYSAGAFASTASNQFLIHANGGVGIGVNNPSVTLDIVDKIRIRGGNAAANRVLTSIDATGTAEWKDISAIASDDDWDKEPPVGTTEVCP